MTAIDQVEFDSKFSAWPRLKTARDLLNWLETELPPITPSRALMIEDSEQARYMLRELLTEIGCTVFEAVEGQAGLEMAIQLNPDCIFLDLLLPDQTGFEILKSLKSRQTKR